MDLSSMILGRRPRYRYVAHMADGSRRPVRKSRGAWECEWAPGCRTSCSRLRDLRATLRREHGAVLVREEVS